jgi:PIN domain nuclease of toxin-antitoxin system
VRILADTHVLVWAALDPERLDPLAREALTTPLEPPVFSVVSIWELVIKAGRRRGFDIDADEFRWQLQRNGFEEFHVRPPHVLELGRLPQLHRDPFDRLLVARARVEDLTLMTADRTVASYPVASMPA